MGRKNEEKMIQRLLFAINNDELLEKLIKEMERFREREMKRTESKKKSKGTS